eukprot:scaffold273_cov138-Skeletonema_menzelii.AAC.1
MWRATGQNAYQSEFRILCRYDHIHAHVLPFCKPPVPAVSVDTSIPRLRSNVDIMEGRIQQLRPTYEEQLLSVEREDGELT